MKKLRVDLDAIVFVMDQQDDFGSTELFDTETGEVINISDEVMDAAESEDEEDIARLPGWEQDLIEMAKAVPSDEEGRFQEIPMRSSSAVRVCIARQKPFSEIQGRIARGSRRGEQMVCIP